MGELRLGINGFGRIGRAVLKHVVARAGARVVGINDLADVEDLAYLLKYDSVHGWYPPKVESDGASITVDGDRIPVHAERDPSRLPWGDLGADVVIEATGALRGRDAAAGHLEGGAGKVIISAPSDDADVTIVVGVNQADYDPDEHDVISNASCTTNCLAPIARVLLDAFGIEHLMASTVHAYTASQTLMDTPRRKRRRGRAAAVSIIPTSTGAALATARVIPELEGRVAGMAFRVPVPDGSVTDVTATLRSEVSVDAVHEALRSAAGGSLAGILRVSEEELVSRDVLGDPHSSIVDGPSTLVLADRVVKVVSWYDNEWGYSARLLDLAGLVAAPSG